jgi:hypothetical protein
VTASHAKLVVSAAVDFLRRTDCASQVTTVKLDPRDHNRLRVLLEHTMGKAARKWRPIAQCAQRARSVQWQVSHQLNALAETTAFMRQAPQSRALSERTVVQRDCGAWRTAQIATQVHSVILLVFTLLVICATLAFTVHWLPTAQIQNSMVPVARALLATIAR